MNAIINSATPKSDIVLVDYMAKYQKAFEHLNREWLTAYFSLEPIDLEMLRNPQKHFKFIVCALMNDQVVGVAALRRVSHDVFELSKMAVDTKYRQKHIGLNLVNRMLDIAQHANAKKVILYTNTKLQPAINLYHKVGFINVPLERNDYLRSDIKMEYIIK